MKNKFDITIIGAGIAGLICAALLSKGRHASIFKIKVIDANSRPFFSLKNDHSLRVSAIASGSMEILDLVGAWSHIKKNRVSPYQGMCVWDKNCKPDSKSSLYFDAAEFAVPYLGYIIENSLIQDALLKVLKDTNVELYFDTKVKEIPSGDLIIGSDGVNSQIRDLANIKTNLWPYNQTAFVTNLNVEHDHKGIARQRFLNNGPLGILPLSNGQVSVVWSINPEKASELIKFNDNKLGEIITQASDSVLGKMTLAGPKGLFPLCAQHAQEYVKHGIALIGDAAHAIHPLAGQGVNLGFQDALELATVLSSAIDNDLYPGDRLVLRGYERARKGPNLTMMHFMTSLNKLFMMDSKFIQYIRMAGMQIFNHSGPIKKHAVRVALGVK
ncbi:MAG: hypothetical protein CMQ54_01245 [Gammaproteobacteria bacterium]|nr:hypothetical protein [Gammaproteobacteria bacterium]|tara:strand:+ start:197 stop:1351 length:1155 start_codon:yes stop_codon:yes gene_type:complete